MSVKAMKAGAVDFLTKPVRDQTLLDAVSAAIARDIARRSEALLVKKAAECPSCPALAFRLSAKTRKLQTHGFP
jgi:FixJ family two-component response regulator